MKILHIINNMSSGGAEKLLVDLLPRLREKEVDVSLLLLNSTGSKAEYLNHIQKCGLPIYELSHTMHLYNPLYIYKIIKFLRIRSFDVIHVHLFPAQYWVAMCSVFVKKGIFVTTEHCSYNKRMSIKPLKRFEKWIYSHYSTIVSISDSVTNSLRKWIGLATDRIVLINNGVNIEKITSAPRLKISDVVSSSIINPFYILMSARFCEQKDHQTLIKALKLLPSNCIVLFAGEGPLLQDCQKMCKHLQLLDQVYFLGYRKNIYSLMKSVDLNVLSTHYEGFSGVTLEMMASGVPFLASDVFGINDIVTNDNVLFPCGDYVHLATKIDRLMHDKELAKKQIEENLKLVQNYDISVMCNKYLDFYESLTYKY